MNMNTNVNKNRLIKIPRLHFPVEHPPVQVPVPLRPVSHHCHESLRVAQDSGQGDQQGDLQGEGQAGIRSHGGLPDHRSV